MARPVNGHGGTDGEAGDAVTGLQQGIDKAGIDQHHQQFNGVDDVHAAGTGQRRLEQAGRKIQRYRDTQQPEHRQECSLLVVCQVEASGNRSAQRDHQQQAEQANQGVHQQQAGQCAITTGRIVAAGGLRDGLHRGGGEAEVHQAKDADDGEDQ